MMIVDVIAVALDATGSDALKYLTGAGGSLAAMYLWNKREVTRGDAAQKRADEVTDKAIVVLTEVNIYLSQSSKNLEAVGGKVTAEHEQTRNHVTQAIQEIKGDGPKRQT